MTDDAPAFTPVLMPAMDSLSPQARHEFRQAVNAGTQEAFTAWAAKHAAQNAGGSVAPTLQSTKGGVISALGVDPSAADPAFAEGMAPADGYTPEIVATLEANGLGAGAFDQFTRPLEAFEAKIATLNEADIPAYVEAREQATLHAVYNGSEAAYERGLEDIKTAATKLGMDLQAIVDSGALVEPETHLKALAMARNVLRGRAPE